MGFERRHLRRQRTDLRVHLDPIGIQDAPRPDEILFALAMADGGRIHARLGGLSQDMISVHDGQRRTDRGGVVSAEER